MTVTMRYAGSIMRHRQTYYFSLKSLTSGSTSFDKAVRSGYHLPFTTPNLGVRHHSHTASDIG